MGPRRCLFNFLFMSGLDSNPWSDLSVPSSNRVLDAHSLNRVVKALAQQSAIVDKEVFSGMNLQEFSELFREKLLRALQGEGFAIDASEIHVSLHDVWKGSGDRPHFYGYEKFPPDDPVFRVKVGLLIFTKVVSPLREWLFRNGHVDTLYLDVIVQPQGDLRSV